MSNPFVGRKATSDGNGQEFERPPADTHDARLVGIVDLGTHVEEYKGETKDRRSVLLVWELVREQMAGSKFNFVIGQSMTLSFHEKSRLLQLLETLRGKPFAADEEIDLSKLLNFPALVTVVHEESKSSGKTYAKIKSVGPMPKGQRAACPVPKRTPFLWTFELDQPIPEYDWLPYHYGQEIGDVIRTSKEHLAMQRRPATVPAGGADDDEDDEAPARDWKEDIPF